MKQGSINFLQLEEFTLSPPRPSLDVVEQKIRELTIEVVHLVNDTSTADLHPIFFEAHWVKLGR